MGSKQSGNKPKVSTMKLAKSVLSCFPLSNLLIGIQICKVQFHFTDTSGIVSKICIKRPCF